ncbi:hypothetical protein [Actinokineospora sp. HUAS TT18]|uniref:hypothetical protein n=1 Tax=Actinokineospora sp. HUAS TT18 TaxID=3447451 RepID=UPI003F51D186
MTATDFPIVDEIHSLVRAVFPWVVRRDDTTVWVAGGRPLGEPLAESRVRAFEQVNGVELPGEYRAFLTQVGDGGVGPGTGLEPVAFWRSVEMPDRVRQIALDGAGRAEVIEIAGHGCTDKTFLVLSGEMYGRLFTRIGSENSLPALHPATDFARWYLDWLEQLDPRRPAERRPSRELVSLLDDRSDERARCALVKELASGDDAAVIGKWLHRAATNDSSRSVRGLVADLLADFLPVAAAQEVLFWMMGDPHRHVRRRALVQLCRITVGSTWLEAVRIARASGDALLVEVADSLEERRQSGRVLGLA